MVMFEESEREGEDYRRKWWLIQVVTSEVALLLMLEATLGLVDT